MQLSGQVSLEQSKATLGLVQMACVIAAIATDLVSMEDLEITLHHSRITALVYCSITIAFLLNPRVV